MSRCIALAPVLIAVVRVLWFAYSGALYLSAEAVQRSLRDPLLDALVPLLMSAGAPWPQSLEIDGVHYSMIRILTPSLNQSAACLALKAAPIAAKSDSSAGTAQNVIFLHGFPDNFLSFHHQMHALAKLGVSSWSLTLPGYDASCALSAEHGDLTIPFLAARILEAIDALALASAPHVIGHDWGAIVAQAIAAAAPHRIASVVSLSIPPLRGFISAALHHEDGWWAAAALLVKQVRLSWYMLFFQVPWLPEVWLQSGGLGYLWLAWSPNAAAAGAFPTLASVGDAFAEPRVLAASVEYYRQNIIALVASELGWPVYNTAALAQHGSARVDRDALGWLLGARNAQLRVPALFVTGRDDGCICVDLFKRALHPADFAAGMQFREIGHGAGHWAHIEQHAEVSAIVARWLQVDRDQSAVVAEESRTG
jgi:pimeloyl-ACP methyl ester carboxylesterase